MINLSQYKFIKSFVCLFFPSNFFQHCNRYASRRAGNKNDLEDKNTNTFFHDDFFNEVSRLMRAGAKLLQSAGKCLSLQCLILRYRFLLNKLRE